MNKQIILLILLVIGVITSANAFDLLPSGWNFLKKETPNIKEPPLKEPTLEDPPLEEPPDSKPFSLPTLSGDDYSEEKMTAPPGGLIPAPKIDGDLLFNHALKCFPALSNFDIDVRLRASYTPRYVGTDTLDGTQLGGVYAGIVATMPLYSSGDIFREREMEAKRRAGAASLISGFINAIEDRNLAIRMMSLWSALEIRSRKRIYAGVAETAEQVGYLEKTAKAYSDFKSSEASIMKYRLSIIADCEESKKESFNQYLIKLTQLQPQLKTPAPKKNQQK